MLVSTNPYQQYRTQGIMTASPAELIIMLYDGLVKQVQMGRLALEEGRDDDAFKALDRAQDIIEELAGSLDMEYEISQQIYDIYEFCHVTLYNTILSKSPVNLRGVVDIIGSLKEAWVAISKQNRVHLPVAAEE